MICYTDLYTFTKNALIYSYRYDPSKASDERLQADDDIFYYDTVFGCRPSGEWTATAVEVIPENNPTIHLDNWGIINPTHEINRVKVVANETIIDNPHPTWRYLDKFCLIQGK
jgi:hypothetical protein